MSVLALEVLLYRFGGQEAVDTGRLESDLLELQRGDVAMMTSPLVQKNLPGLFEDIRVVPEVREIYLDRMIRPRRNNVRDVLVDRRF